MTPRDAAIEANDTDAAGTTAVLVFVVAAVDAVPT